MFVLPTNSHLKPLERLLAGISAELRKGSFRSGGAFPTPERLATATGEPLAECLEAVNELLGRGVLKQRVNGELYLAPSDGSGAKIRRASL